MAGARAYIALVEKLGGEAEVASRQGSIYAAFKGTDGKFFYPLHLWSDGQLVSLSFRWLHARPGLREDAARQKLLDRLVEIVGPMTTNNLKGFPSFKVALLADPSVASKVEAWLAVSLNQMR